MSGDALPDLHVPEHDQLHVDAGDVDVAVQIQHRLVWLGEVRVIRDGQEKPARNSFTVRNFRQGPGALFGEHDNRTCWRAGEADQLHVGHWISQDPLDLDAVSLD